MPIQIIWGNDIDTSNKEIEKFIESNVSTIWSDINISKFNGEDTKQVLQALDEMLTPPFGEGSRIIVIKNSPILNTKNDEITNKFEINAKNIPKSTHLVLQNIQKPDSRMKSTKFIKGFLKEKKAIELSFNLPSVWDRNSQIKYIKNIAEEMNITIDQNVGEKIIEAIGIDSSRLVN